jgi:hypothetical protein
MGSGQLGHGPCITRLDIVELGDGKCNLREIAQLLGPNPVSDPTTRTVIAFPNEKPGADGLSGLQSLKRGVVGPRASGLVCASARELGVRDPQSGEVKNGP